MKRFRLPVIVAAVVAALAVLTVILAFSSSFQTWMVRRAIADRPGLRATVGSVSAGMKRVALKDVRLNQPGSILILPEVEADLPVTAAAWSRKVHITRLVAKGWVLDLSQPVPDATAPNPPRDPARPAAAPPPVTREQAPATAGSAAVRAFNGVFAHLQLPADFSLDGVLLEGDVILPEARGRVKVKIAGGGLAAGREGKFDVGADATLADPNVNAVRASGLLSARMDTPRSFTHVTARLDAAAAGAKFPRGVKLHTTVSAAKADRGENYAVAVVSEGRELLKASAELPRNSPAFSGAWKVDLRDVDIAPFALGVPLPTFATVGEGSFDGEVGLDSLHVAGRLNGAVDRLQVLRPELATIGPLKISADFDLAGRGATFVVQKLEAAVNAANPVATVRALQPFQLNFSTGELRTADVRQELIGLAMHAIPVGWIAPLVKGAALSGGHLRGELSATTRGGGITVRTVTPLMIDGVTIVRGAKPFATRLDLALNASADYTPQGWQAEVGNLTAKQSDTLVLSLDAKAGQLSGRDQPLKATGKLSANLPALLGQPAFAEKVVLTSGDAAMDFVLSVGTKQEIQATIALNHLVTTVDKNAVKLPTLTTNLRADFGTDGRIAFNAPIQIEQADRKSDLTIHGSIGPEKDKLRAIEAEITSTQLVVDDAQLLAAVVPGKGGRGAPSAKPAEPRPDPAPPWAGLHGSIALQLKSLVYSDVVQMSNVTGRLRINAGTLKLENMQAGVGETGRANVSGAVTFNGGTSQPYALAADVAVKEFDPGPLFRMTATQQPPTVEGRFDLTSKLAGRAATLGTLASGAGGSFQLTSKGGVFRGLPVNVGNIVENTSKLAAWLASAGTALSAMTGKKDYADVASKAEAVAELARGWNPIPYDQLSVVVSRDAALNTTLRNFTLISPEVRLSGSGTALHKPGSTLLDDALAMEFTLRARGRQGELLKYLGALEPQTDDLGYAACTVPLKVAGTLGKPDTSEINTKLTALAIEKSGFGDKAAEFLNRIRGAK